MAERYYRLKFTVDSKEFCISNNSSMFDALPDKDLRNLLCTLQSMEYDKSVYSPCKVVAKLSVSLNGTSGSMSMPELMKKLSACFISARVDWGFSTQDIMTEEPESYLGENYVVYQVNPGYDCNASGKCILELVIYSRDKLLTMDKFSRSFVNAKLGGNIIKDTLSSSGALGACAVDYTDDPKRLQVIKYQGEENVAELIHPYKVQYNEDFYSFISRIACRHGEFLYYEDGKLRLGLAPVSGGERTIKSIAVNLRSVENIKSISYPCATMAGTTAVTSFYRDYQQKIKNAGAKEVVFNEDNAYDEYFDAFLDGKEPASIWGEKIMGNYATPILNYLFPAIGNYFGSYSFLSAEKIAKFTIDIASVPIQDALRTAFVNDKFKESVYDNAEKNASSPKFNEDEQHVGGTLRQFSSASEEVSKLMSTFFATIKSQEEEVAGNVQKLDLEPGKVDLKVGDYVWLNDDDSVFYVVTKVTGAMEMVLEKDNKGRILWKTHESQTIEIVPKPEKSAVFIPPSNNCIDYPKASAQAAVIADSDDPRYLGRVRIRYPWQSENDPASPWIRRVSSLATPSGGINFRPRKGDEVMVDYIGGNIDRPYVVGAMFNEDVHPNFKLYTPYRRTIRSESGQMINFATGNFNKWISSVVPAYGFLVPFMPWVTKSINSALDGKGKALMMDQLHGDLTLTDCFGLWTIKGDTSAREITIDSMIGKVTMSALTGITISAPHGNVKIEGKNVEILAGNNIKIESGIYIKDTLENNRQTQMRNNGEVSKMETFVEGYLEDILMSKVDLSLLRTIKEAIKGPSEGLLTLKSNRYLAIEAGDGCAFDKNGGSYDFQPMSEINKAKNIANNGGVGHIADDIRIIKNVSDHILMRATGIAVDLCQAMQAYDTFCNKPVENGFPVNPGLTSLDIASVGFKGKAFDSISKLKDYHKKYLEVDDIYQELLGVDLINSAYTDYAAEYYNLAQNVHSKAVILNNAMARIPNRTRKYLKNTSFKNLEDIMVKAGEELRDTLLKEFDRWFKKKNPADINKLLDSKVIFRRAVGVYLQEKKFIAFHVPVDCQNDDEWRQAVSDIRLMDNLSMPSFMGKLKADAKKKYAFWNLIESDSWAPGSKGKILFSQDSGITHSIHNNGFEQKTNGAAGLKDIRNALLGIPPEAGVPAPGDVPREEILPE